MLDDEGGIILKTHKDAEGKFGRILGELWRTTEYGDQSINQYLVDNTMLFVTMVSQSLK